MEILEALDRFLEVLPPPGDCPAWQPPPEENDDGDPVHGSRTVVAGTRNLKRSRAHKPSQSRKKPPEKDLPPDNSDEDFQSDDDFRSFEACPFVAEINGRLQSNADAWATYRTALAAISGRLEGAMTTADLIDAAEHGQVLLNSGVIEISRLKAEFRRTLHALSCWGERVDRELAKSRRAKINSAEG